MLFRRLVIALGTLALAACGTLQVGIEPATPRPTLVPPATTPSGVPSAPTATVTASPPERINFPMGSTIFSFTTRLNVGVPERYVLQVLALQKMTITTSRDTTMEVFDAQNHPVAPLTAGPNQWQGIIPATNDYIIVLHGDGLITISISIPPLR